MPLSTSIVSTPLYNWRTMELNMRKEKLLNSPIYTLPTGSKCDEPSFKIIELVPKNHHYNTMIPFKFQSSFMNVLHKEFILLTNDLPPGIFVRSFEDRVDLLCAMIEGPKNTPYENGLFFFDIKLPANYPLSPPQFFFISYSPTVIKNYSTSYDRLNPNLYQKGKVCVSLLGTWKGSESENWTRKCTLLQVLVSIQGLILVNEPFYNEPGYESQKDTPFGRESSRKYNEMVLLRVVESVNNILTNPPEVFQREILIHFQKIGKAYFSKMLNLMDLTYNVPGIVFKEFVKYLNN